MRYVVARRRALWPQMTAARDSQVATSAEAARETAALCGGALERLVGRLARGGVPLLAGTDAGNPYVLHGFSLHDELALLVHAGLTPLAALRAATLGPATFLGATDSLGTIAPGKLADLVLLDANPLENIRNTRRISAVVANGRLFAGADRERLLHVPGGEP
jgi:imidazolonepropionase-like amidohydrolase